MQNNQKIFNFSKEKYIQILESKAPASKKVWIIKKTGIFENNSVFFF